MIYIALGANLPSRVGPPAATLAAALGALARRGVRVVAASRLWRSAPVPASDQPWFVNQVVAVATDLPPDGLLAVLHEVEAEFGRERPAAESTRWPARTLDLDLLDYDGRVAPGPGGVILPHPRLQERTFVLRPLAEIAADWRHPVSGRTLASLIADLPEGQEAVPVEP